MYYYQYKIIFPKGTSVFIYEPKCLTFAHAKTHKLCCEPYRVFGEQISIKTVTVTQNKLSTLLLIKCQIIVVPDTHTSPQHLEFRIEWRGGAGPGK